MAELQLSVVSDAESKQQIMGQIKQWEENLERLHCEQFRLRCYMASLQAGELPNPKVKLFFCTKTRQLLSWLKLPTWLAKLTGKFYRRYQMNLKLTSVDGISQTALCIIILIHINLFCHKLFRKKSLPQMSKEPHTHAKNNVEINILFLK